MNGWQQRLNTFVTANKLLEVRYRSYFMSLFTMLQLTFTIFFFLVIFQSAYSQETSAIPSTLPTKSPITIMHDPTKPYTGKIEAGGQLQLRSILIGKDRRIALINDTFVQVGDAIGEAKVIAIKEDFVVLIESGRTETLYLFTNDIRK